MQQHTSSTWGKHSTAISFMLREMISVLEIEAFLLLLQNQLTVILPFLNFSTARTWRAEWLLIGGVDEAEKEAQRDHFWERNSSVFHFLIKPCLRARTPLYLLCVAHGFELLGFS